MESDFRMCMTKKYFHFGFQDKNSNFVTKDYLRDEKDQIMTEVTFLPKFAKGSKTIKLVQKVKVKTLISSFLRAL